MLLLHSHYFRLKDVPCGDKVVFFVRDPASRFVSGFLSRLRKGRPRYNIPWSSQEKQAFGRFKAPNDLALALGSRDPETRGAAARAMQHIGHVGHSYAVWLGSVSYLRSRMADILFIGFQESLDQDFERLKGRLFLPAGLSLPTDDTTAHRTPDHLDTHLVPEARANLKEWYSDDYRFLELCRNVGG